MKKILLSFILGIVVLFGFTSFGCGDEPISTPPGVEQPGESEKPTPENPAPENPKTEDPKTEQKDPEKPDPEKPDTETPTPAVVDYSAVADAFKTFAVDYPLVFVTEEDFEEEPCEDCLKLFVVDPDAQDIDQIEVALEEFEYDGFSVSCELDGDKIVFIITAD